MAAYVVVEIDVEDLERYETYKKMSPISIAKYGGRFIVRGGKAQPLEGSWAPQRFVVVEFESVDRAKEWWNSPEYAEAKALRQEISKARMIVVEGA